MSRNAFASLPQDESTELDPQIDASAADARNIVTYLDGQDYPADATMRISVADLHTLLSSFLALYQECRGNTLPPRLGKVH